MRALALIVFLLAPAAARGDAISIQKVFDVNGDPVLVANFGSAKPSWEACDPDCRAASPDQSLTAGPTAAGTFFRASVDYGGSHYSADTPAWQGRVTATTPPALGGTAHVGSSVTPAAGPWSGGWPGDYSELGAIACRSAAAKHCRTLLDYRYDQSSSVRVPSWASGRYLFATDAREAADTVFGGVGYRSPGSVPVAPPSQTVAYSAAAGPVTGPRAPRVHLRKHPVVRHHRLLVGRVAYSRPCGAHVELTGTNGVADTNIELRHGGRLMAKRPPGALTRVTVNVDDGPAVVRRF